MRNLSRRFLMMLVLAAVTVAMSALAAFAAPKVYKIKYEDRGRVEVEFTRRVLYRNTKVTVKDNKGVSYKAKITDRDDDEIDFVILKYKQGRTYTFTISGIKKRGETKFSKVKGKVKIPASAKKGTIKVKKVEYDGEDLDLDIDFATKVQWKSPKITITYGGTNYVRYIDGYDDDELEVKVKALKRGRKYSYKITGIRARGASAFKTYSGTFVA